MSIDGNWTLTLNTPMGPQSRTATLAANGTTLTGSVDGPQGSGPIQDGRIDGNSFSWSVYAPQVGGNVVFTGTVDGDRLSGSAQLGAFGAAPFEGVRA